MSIPDEKSANGNPNNENKNSTLINPKIEPIDYNTSGDGSSDPNDGNAAVPNSKRLGAINKKRQKKNVIGAEKINNPENEKKNLRFKGQNMKSDRSKSEKYVNLTEDSTSEEEGSGESSNFNSEDSGTDTEEEKIKLMAKKKRRQITTKTKRLKRTTGNIRKSGAKLTRNKVVNKKSKRVRITKTHDDSDSELERIRERRRISQYQRRQNPEVRARERAFQNLRRKDPAVRERERQRQALRRQDPEYRKRENLTIAARRRNNEELRELENAKMALRRRDPDYARREREMHKKNLLRRKQGSNSQTVDSEISQSVSSKNGEDSVPQNNTDNEITCS